MVGNVGTAGRAVRSPVAVPVATAVGEAARDLVEGVTRPPRRFLLLTPPVCPRTGALAHRRTWVGARHRPRPPEIATLDAGDRDESSQFRLRDDAPPEIATPGAGDRDARSQFRCGVSAAVHRG